MSKIPTCTVEHIKQGHQTVYGASNICFSVVSYSENKKKYLEICTSSSCKTFIHDAICGSIIDKPSSTRLITYPKVNLKKAALSVCYLSREDALNYSTLALKILKSLEKEKHYRRTVIKQPSDNGASILYLPSVQWFHNPVALSLYTSIIRMVCVDVVQKIIKEHPSMSAVNLLRKISVIPIFQNDINYLKTFVNSKALDVFMNEKSSYLFDKKASVNFTGTLPGALHEPGIQSWSISTGRVTLPWSKWRDISDMQKKYKEADK